MSKVPSKINNFEGLEKVCHKFPQTFLWKRHDMPHQNLDRERSTKYCYSSNMAEHDSSHISSLTILDHATKGQTPTLNLPSFFKNIFLTSTFFQIWRYSFWRSFSVGDSDCRRFDRTIRDIRLTSRPEIHSDSGSDGPNYDPDDSDDLRRYLITFHFIMFNWFICISFHCVYCEPVIPKESQTKS